MRKILLLLWLPIAFGSCRKEEKPIVPAIPVGAEAPVSKECYLGSLNKDTVSMTLELKGTEVTSGKLRYKFFEKDNNEGELVGLIKGDTLFATYTFTSEGASTVREVAFLKKGPSYVEGSGEVVDDNKGNVTFKDTRKLTFDSKIILNKSTCK